MKVNILKKPEVASYVKKATEKELDSLEKYISREIEKAQSEEASLHKLCRNKKWASTSERGKLASLERREGFLIDSRLVVHQEQQNRLYKKLVVSSRKLDIKRKAEGYRYEGYDTPCSTRYREKDLMEQGKPLPKRETKSEMLWHIVSA